MSVRGLLVLSFALILAACSSDELILPGEREPVRPEAAVAEATEIPGIDLPPATRNNAWTQIGGNAQHLGEHLALDGSLRRVWSVDIGQGNSKRARLITAPIVVGETVYAMDAAAQVSAISTAGRVLWRTDATPEGEAARDGFGGGLAYDEGRLFVTTAHGEVLALDPVSGEILWRTAVDAAIRAAPAVAEGRVVVVARSDVAYGLDAETGTLDWRTQGVGLGAGVLGGAAPAIRGPVTVLPFQSGEVNAVLTRNGLTVWNAAISGGRRELVRSQISDITGAPVIDNDIVYAANQAGRLVKFDRRNGARLWTALEGSLSPALPMDNSVFLVSDEAAVIRLSKETGETWWSVQLPQWRKPDDRRDAYNHFGPVLGGGVLWVAGSDGLLRSFNPATGALLASTDIPGGAAAEPAVANGTLYVVSLDGRLHAYR